jgi:hypothetical protein
VTVVMHGLCYDLFYILMPYGGLMDQLNVYVMNVVGQGKSLLVTQKYKCTGP